MERCEPQTLMSVVWASSVCEHLPPPPAELSAWVARLPFKLLPRLVHQPGQHPGSSQQSEGEFIGALSDEIVFEHDRILSATGLFASLLYWSFVDLSHLCRGLVRAACLCSGLRAPCLRSHSILLAGLTLLPAVDCQAWR